MNIFLVKNGNRTNGKFSQHGNKLIKFTVNFNSRQVIQQLFIQIYNKLTIILVLK